MRSLVIEQVGDSVAGSRWKEGAVERVLANEKYRGLMIWGKKTFERRPGTRQLVARALPRDSWRTLERPERRPPSEPADRPPSIAQSSVALCSATSTLSAAMAALRPRVPRGLRALTSPVRSSEAAVARRPAPRHQSTPIEH